MGLRGSQAIVVGLSGDPATGSSPGMDQAGNGPRRWRALSAGPGADVALVAAVFGDRMTRRFHAFLALLAALWFANVQPALADTKIATVDFQRALNETTEGKNATTRLQNMFNERKAALDKLKTSLDAMTADYQKQQMLLSDTARKQKEEEINQAYFQFQQATQQYEGEFQTAYNQAMQTLIDKLKKVATTIATEKQVTLLVELNEGGVLYASPSIDITAELITRYNSANPGK
jgi:Skp family chaperone for outer membrane proteins